MGPSDKDLDAQLADSEVRLATALASLAGATFALREAVHDRRDLRSPPERREREIADRKRRFGEK